MLFVLWAGLGVSCGALIYLGIPLIYAALARFSLSRRTKRCGAIALTFDDGPGEILTPAIIKLLRRRQSNATFFVLGSNVEGREELVRNIVSEGHEICSHGFSHVNHWRVFPWTAIRDIRNGYKAINKALQRTNGKYPYRPPNGKLTILTLSYLIARRIPVVFWTFDSGDTWSTLPSLEARLSAYKRTPRSVVLVHDFDRRDMDRRDYVVDFAERLLTHSQNLELRHLTVSELVSA